MSWTEARKGDALTNTSKLDVLVKHLIDHASILQVDVDMNCEGCFRLRLDKIYNTLTDIKIAIHD